MNETEERQVLRLAALALHHAKFEQWQLAANVVKRIDLEHGGEGLNLALLCWCDKLADHLGLGGNPIALKFHNLKTGDTDIDQTPPEIVWAGRVVSARISMDRETYLALIDALPDDPEAIGAHVFAVLKAVALNLTNPQPSLS